MIMHAILCVLLQAVLAIDAMEELIGFPRAAHDIYESAKTHDLSSGLKAIIAAERILHSTTYSDLKSNSNVNLIYRTTKDAYVISFHEHIMGVKVKHNPHLDKELVIYPLWGIPLHYPKQNNISKIVENAKIVNKLYNDLRNKRYYIPRQSQDPLYYTVPNLDKLGNYDTAHALTLLFLHEYTIRRNLCKNEDKALILSALTALETTIKKASPLLHKILHQKVGSALHWLGNSSPYYTVQTKGWFGLQPQAQLTNMNYAQAPSSLHANIVLNILEARASHITDSRPLNIPCHTPIGDFWVIMDKDGIKINQFMHEYHPHVKNEDHEKNDVIDNKTPDSNSIIIIKTDTSDMTKRETIETWNLEESQPKQIQEIYQVLQKKYPDTLPPMQELAKDISYAAIAPISSWAKEDIPMKEITTLIYNPQLLTQENRNAFIDYPELHAWIDEQYPTTATDSNDTVESSYSLVETNNNTDE